MPALLQCANCGQRRRRHGATCSSPAAGVWSSSAQTLASRRKEQRDPVPVAPLPSRESATAASRPRLVGFMSYSGENRPLGASSARFRLAQIRAARRPIGPTSITAPLSVLSASPAKGWQAHSMYRLTRTVVHVEGSGTTTCATKALAQEQMRRPPPRPFRFRLKSASGCEWYFAIASRAPKVAGWRRLNAFARNGASWLGWRPIERRERVSAVSRPAVSKRASAVAVGVAFLMTLPSPAAAAVRLRVEASLPQAGMSAPLLTVSEASTAALVAQYNSGPVGQGGPCGLPSGVLCRIGNPAARWVESNWNAEGRAQTISLEVDGPPAPYSYFIAHSAPAGTPPPLGCDAQRHGHDLPA